MKKLTLILFVMATIWANQSQAQVAINTDGNNPDASAMLDIKSTNSGLLIPRMTITQRDAISSPANGLMVYVSDDNSFYYFDGSAWSNVSASGESPVETWQTPTLLNGVTNYGGTYNDVGFYKDRNRVYLRGLAANVGYNTVMFILPEGYRPTGSSSFYTIGNSQGQRVHIDIDGTVTLLYNSAGWLSLENISFRID